MRNPRVFNVRDVFSTSIPSGVNGSIGNPGGTGGGTTTTASGAKLIPIPGSESEFAIALAYNDQFNDFATAHVFFVPYMIDTGVKIVQAFWKPYATDNSIEMRIRVTDRRTSTDNYSDIHEFTINRDDSFLIETVWDVSDVCEVNTFKDYLFAIEFRFADPDNAVALIKPYFLYVDSPASMGASKTGVFRHSYINPIRFLGPG